MNVDLLEHLVKRWQDREMHLHFGGQPLYYEQADEESQIPYVVLLMDDSGEKPSFSTNADGDENKHRIEIATLCTFRVYVRQGEIKASRDAMTACYPNNMVLPMVGDLNFISWQYEDDRVEQLKKEVMVWDAIYRARHSQVVDKSPA